MVEEGPWVMTTVRAREGLDLGSVASDLAIAGMFSLSGSPAALAHAAASLSFPMMMSQ